MSLGLPNSSGNGEYMPIVTWDARAGRMFRVDRSQDSTGAWVSNKTDITNDRPTFAIDFGSVEVGHMAFLPTGPSFSLVPLGHTLPAKPSNDHKTGVRLKLFSSKHFGGAREFASSAKAVLSAVDALHTQFEAAPEAAQGKIPVVRLDGSTAINTKGPNGIVTSYSPLLTVFQWTDRPAELGERTVPPPGAPAQQRPTASAAPPANHVPPPAMPEPPAYVTAPVPPTAEPVGMPDGW